MYIYYNPNPDKKLVDDCIIRAICMVTGKSWEYIYTDLYAEGLKEHDWPWKNYIWGGYLKKKGFEQFLIPDTCPYCYTVRQFAKDNREGAYILATGSHVVAVINGNWYDTFDSGDEVPAYVFRKKGVNDGY